MKVNLDCPKGYACWYVTHEACEVFADVKNFNRTLDILVYILYAKLEILKTMKIVNGKDDFDQDSSLD
nr:13128_t:CDS:2 [Entrophospora candida]